jgi:uncharacterized repeat protein (TIGR01451 family)
MFSQLFSQILISIRTFRPIRSLRSISVAMLFFWMTLFLTIQLSLKPHQAEAAALNISFLQVVDGTAPFDTAAGPGLDTGTNNGIIRTVDTIAYTWNYSVNNPGLPANNVVITPAVLPLGATWQALPAVCKTTGVTPVSSLSPDGRTLICNIGNVTTNVSQNFTASARLNATLKQGDTITMNALIQDAANTVGDTSTNEVTTVSSRPDYDVRKNYTPQLVSQLDSTGTIPGLVIYYGLGIVTNRQSGTPLSGNNNFGHEQLQSPINLSDQVSAISPNARLFTWGGANLACGQNFNQSPAGLYIPDLPRGRNLNGGGYNNNNSVTDSGTFTCTQAGGAGTNVSISVIGTNTTGNNINNTTGNNFPNQTASNVAAIPASDGYVAAGFVAIWIPQTDYNLANRSITNTYNGFAPVGISGQPNDVQPTPNDVNTVTISTSGTITGGTGTSTRDKFYRQADGNAVFAVPASSSFAPANPNTQAASVTPTQNITTRLEYSNTGSIPLTNSILCDKIDNTKHIPRIDVAAINQALRFAQDGSGSNIAASLYTVEYASTPNTNTNQRTSTCNDADGPWSTTLAGVTGGASAVTKIRVKIPSIPPITRYIFSFSLQVNSPLPNDTLITNYLSIKSDQVAAGVWQNAAADITSPTTAKANSSDRLRVVQAIARIGKNVSSTSVAAGNEVIFTLVPTFTSSLASQASNLIVTDTLPPEFTYVATTSAVAPTSITVNTALNTPLSGPNGQTTIIWNLPSVAVNSAIPNITFRAAAKSTVPNGTAVNNQVNVTSILDSSTVFTANRGVTISNPSAFNVNKVTTTPVIETGRPFSYDLQYINLTSSQNLPFVDIIDVLPYVGDSVRPAPEGSRNPPSAFAGTAILSGAPTGGTGVTTYYYTSRTPSLISIDPQSASNLPRPNGSTTVWCTQANFGTGSCPTSFNNVTAFRAITGALNVGSGQQTIRANFTTSGNLNGNIHTNRFGAEGSGLPNRVYADESVVTTVSGSISGFVYVDANNNAIKDTGEAAINTVTVTLTGTDAYGNAVNRTTTTDPTGRYEFLGVVSSNATGYTITETQPAGFIQGLINAVGTVNSTATGINTVQDVFSAVLITNNLGTLTPAIGINYNFGERSGSPKIILVKRITDVKRGGVSITPTGSQALNIFNDDTLTTEDNNTLWPTPSNTYLRGAITGGSILPADQLEYTIYFLSSGNGAATNVTICDLVPDKTTFLGSRFTGLSPVDSGGTASADLGIAISNSPTLSATPTAYMTSAVDGDRGFFYDPNITPPTNCSKETAPNSGVYAPMVLADNTNGLVVVNIVKRTTVPPVPALPSEVLPNATSAGNPPNSYGFVRFVVTVN